MTCAMIVDDEAPARSELRFCLRRPASPEEIIELQVQGMPSEKLMSLEVMSLGYLYA